MAIGRNAPRSGAASPPDDPFAGTRFRACRLLAKGGMGEIHLVEHVELGRQFVAKVLRGEFASDAGILDRLRLEAHALSRLEHPNIVSIMAFDTTRDGRPFYVMEYLR